MTRLPTFFLCHGGGPWPYLSGAFRRQFDQLEASLSSVVEELGSLPKAVLIVSAHWEAEAFSFSSHPEPGMYYDYSGFPEHTYRVRYEAPGAPEVARRARECLLSAGLGAELDPHRGFDHATFTLMQPMRPEADIPVVQMSIRADLDAEAHLIAGHALAPLRSEGILIIGSGMTYHNLRHLGESGRAPSRQFNDWLISSLDGADSKARNRALLQWRDAPGALFAHPEPDHLLPLMVVAGAASDDRAHVQFRQDDFCGHIAISSYRFGSA